MIRRRKSKLAARYPIRSTAALVADRAKYGKQDDLVLRLVTKVCRQGRDCRVTLECGHMFLVTDENDGIVWPDRVPGYLDCLTCLEALERAVGLEPPPAASN